MSSFYILQMLHLKKICTFFSEIYYYTWLKDAKIKKWLWPYCYHPVVENGVGVAFNVIFGFAKIGQLV